MIIDEERSTFKRIQQKLIKYENDLRISIKNTTEISDSDLAFSMANMYGQMLAQYIKNKQKPYFAKIIFKQDNSESNTTAYIGRIGFANLNNDDIIIDWRAPIAELYYNSKLGETYFFVEKEKVYGQLLLKRQIIFTNGEITSVYDIDNSISSDEFLLPYLTQVSNNRLTNIISTIQKEQDNIIRMPLYSNIIVQGVAGSGKTTVALHRLSYLIYNYRTSLKAEDYCIITPNKVFKQYIAELLSDLDADQAKSTRIEDIFQNIVGDKYSLLNKNNQYNHLFARNLNSQYLSCKGSYSFQKLLDNYIKDLEENYFKKEIVINNIVLLSAEESFDIYTKIQLNTVEEKTILWASIVNNKIQNDSTIKYILKEKLDNNEISFKNKMDTERIIEKGITNKLKTFFNKKINILSLYNNFISKIDKYCNNIEEIYDKNLKLLKTETLANLNKKIISYDDLGAILYLATKLYKYGNYLNIRHVLIDEAQDFSYLLFKSLKGLFRNATFSIFGDLAQALYSYQTIENWNEILSIYDNIELMYLNKSYRTTIEIIEKSNTILRLLKLPEASNVIRHGEFVKDVYSTNIDEMIVKQINNFKQTSFNTFAVICKNDKEMAELKNSVLLTDLNFIDENSISQQTKINILTVETSKGLEFDMVVIYNENSYNLSDSIDLKKLYVAETRALHKLVINHFI